MKFHDIEQNSDEWFDLRVGRVTSSKMGTVMANFGKAFGDPAKQYAQTIAMERFLGKKSEEESYQSADMLRGHELEPIARYLYEIEMMVSVSNGGFVEDGNLGDSPDGIVRGGESYPIEIKSVKSNAHWAVIKRKGAATSYKWQYQFHIMMNEAKFCDFISYCPEFPEDKQLFIYRVGRDEEMISQMKSRIKEFELLVDENIELLK